MADHEITISVVMEDMDGTPEQSAEVLLDNPGVLQDYINGGDFTVLDAVDVSEFPYEVEETA